ncbi:VOC family protein [bacterium]|nr:VOC family protein [bacterium]
MLIKTMGLAWVSVKDVAQAKQFFVETLGLTMASGSDEYGWMELVAADQGFRLGVGACHDAGQPVQPGNNAVVTMTVDDVVAAKKTLEGRGVQFVGDIVEVPGHVKMIFFKDVDGNYFHLVQMLSVE